MCIQKDDKMVYILPPHPLILISLLIFAIILSCLLTLSIWLTAYLNFPHSWYSHDSRVHPSLTPGKGRRTRETLQLPPDSTRTTAAATSLMPKAFPAVTVPEPSLMNAGLCFDNASTVVPWWRNRSASTVCVCLCVCVCAFAFVCVQQLIHSAPTIEKCWSYVAVYAQNKAQKHHSREEFPDYWWLFRTQHLSHYSTRLVEERKNNSDFRLFQVFHFKIVTTQCYYYCRLGQTIGCSV